MTHPTHDSFACDIAGNHLLKCAIVLARNTLRNDLALALGDVPTKCPPAPRMRTIKAAIFSPNINKSKAGSGLKFSLWFI